MAIGTHSNGPDGTLIPYTTTPITSPAFVPTEEQGLALINGLLEHPSTGSGIADRLLSIERFETILGVYDHDTPNPDNPYPISSHNEFSATTRDSIAARQIRMLLRYKVPQKTNMSLVELMALPCETFKITVNACRTMTNTEMEAVDDLEDTLDSFAQRMG